MNKLKKELDELIGDSPRFHEPLKRKIIMEAKKAERPSSFKWLGNIKYAVVLVILLICVTSFLVLALDDNPEQVQVTQPNEQTLTDPDTVEEIETFTSYEEPLEEWDFGYDSMDRGDHHFYKYPLLIDPFAYQDKEMARGDVVVYEYENSYGVHQNVARVIGLPGETIEIKEGQIFIDDRKLDTFYGKAHYRGHSSSEEHDKAVLQGDAPQNIGASDETFSTTMEKIQLGSDEVFLVGDHWGRSNQHAIKISKVEAEVLGYSR